MQFFLETRKNCSLWKAIWIQYFTNWIRKSSVPIPISNIQRKVFWNRNEAKWFLDPVGEVLE